jgi:hypothetical protein
MTKKEYDKKIAPLIANILDIAKITNTPIFFSCMLAQNDEEPISETNIEYANEIYSPRAAGIHLSRNDYMAEYIKITNGFVAQPTSRSDSKFYDTDDENNAVIKNSSSKNEEFIDDIDDPGFFDDIEDNNDSDNETIK